MMRRYVNAPPMISSGVFMARSTGAMATWLRMTVKIEMTAEKRDRRANGTVKTPVVFRAETLRHVNGKALRKALDKPQHEPVQPVRRTERRQRVYAERLPHNGGIHHRVELLKHVAQHQRYRKGEDQLCRAAFVIFSEYVLVFAAINPS